jgi:hypothetical protein
VKRKKKSSTLENLLAELAPDELFKAVRDEWDLPEVSQLANLIVEYLKAKAPPPPMQSEQPTRRM